MNYNYVDTNLCDFTSEIRAIMAGKTPQRRYARYADPSLAHRINRDIIEKKPKNTACKDGKDDGKISFKEKISNFGKGIIAPIKTMFSSPKNIAITALSIAGGAALIALTGGAAAPIMAAAGIVGGAVQIGRGIYNQATAKTDEQAQKAWQQMGSGTFTTAVSAVSAKASLKAAKVDTKGMSFFGAIGKCFKDIPKNIKLSFSNASKNIGSIIDRFKNAANAVAGNKPAGDVIVETGENISNSQSNNTQNIKNATYALPEPPKKLALPEPPKRLALPEPPKRLALPVPGESVSEIQPPAPTPVQPQVETPIPAPAPKNLNIINYIKNAFKNTLKVFGLFK